MLSFDSGILRCGGEPGRAALRLLPAKPVVRGGEPVQAALNSSQPPVRVEDHVWSCAARCSPRLEMHDFVSGGRLDANAECVPSPERLQLPSTVSNCSPDHRCQQ